MQEAKISYSQAAILLYVSTAPSGILLIPVITAQAAERNLWIPPLIASISGLILIAILLRLQKMYPQLTIVQYSERIFGKVLGKLLMLVLLIHLFHINAIILRSYGEFIVGAFLPHVPLVVILGGMVFLVAAAVYAGGWEVLARLGQLILPIIIIIWIILIILSIPDWEPSNMLPLLEDGMRPVLEGAYHTTIWFGNFILLGMILPHINRQQKVLRYTLLAWIAILLTVVVTCLVALFIFGETVVLLTYPFMEVVRYISIGEFIEHIDALLLLIWVTGSFLQLTVFHMAIAEGVVNWMNVSNYKYVSFPLGILLVIAGHWLAPNLQELNAFLTGPHVYLSIFIRWGIPLLLLIVLQIKLIVQSSHRRKVQ